MAAVAHPISANSFVDNISDLSALIQNFDGSCPVQDFLADVVNMSMIGHWPDFLTMQVAKSKCVGPIAELLRTRFDINYASTFTDFSDRLTAALTTDKPLSHRLHSLLICTQKPAETVDEFATRLRFCSKELVEWDSGADTLVLKDQFVASTFVRGLRRTIQEYMIVQNPTTFATAVTIARNFETAMTLCAPDFESCSPADSKRPSGASPNWTQSDRQEKSEPSRRRKRRRRPTRRSSSWFRHGVRRKTRKIQRQGTARAGAYRRLHDKNATSLWAYEP